MRMLKKNHKNRINESKESLSLGDARKRTLAIKLKKVFDSSQKSLSSTFNLKNAWNFHFEMIFKLKKKKYFPDDIKEEEMEIEAFDYDDDFENDPSFTISSDLENRQFDEDELEDFTVDDSDLDEPRDTPRKRRRKVQEHETYKSFK